MKIKCWRENILKKENKSVKLVFGSPEYLCTLPAEMFGGSDFWLETNFHGDEAKNSKIADSKTIANSQNIFAKISWIGPWVD